MATIITNRATVNYNYGTSAAVAVSNVTSTVLNGVLSIEKTSLSDNYRIGQELTYIITVSNNGASLAEDITVVDDLGSYQVNGSYITPLTFIGNAQLFINGVFDSILMPTAGENSIIFDIPSIPAGGNAQIIYQARVNEFANGEAGSEITNTACADFDCGCPCNEPICDSYTVTANEFAELRIVKSVCPNPVVCGETLTYVIDIYNYGNIAATDVVITDTFDPALSDLAVRVDGVIIPETDYNYVGGVLTLPNAAGDEITVPAATFAQDPTTGVVTVTPGRIQVIVTGTV